MILAAAAIVSGWMTLYSNGAASGPPVHGTGSARDCGRHDFKRDDGRTFSVVIACEMRR